MDVSFPEHRVYTVLAAFQAAFVMIGTFAIRIATSPDLFNYRPAPTVAMWLRDWGYIFLILPAAGLVWAIREANRDETSEKAGQRIAVALLMTAVVGGFFWWMWDRSTIYRPTMIEAF